MGFRLPKEAMVFGGTKYITATDIAVAKGLCSIGQPQCVKSLSSKMVDSAILEVRRMLEEVIDQVKVIINNLNYFSFNERFLIIYICLTQFGQPALQS